MRRLKNLLWDLKRVGEYEKIHPSHEMKGATNATTFKIEDGFDTRDFLAYGCEPRLPMRRVVRVIGWGSLDQMKLCSAYLAHW
jgi:hypothetical protein